MMSRTSSSSPHTSCPRESHLVLYINWGPYAICQWHLCSLDVCFHCSIQLTPWNLTPWLPSCATLPYLPQRSSPRVLAPVTTWYTTSHPNDAAIQKGHSRTGWLWFHDAWDSQVRGLRQWGRLNKGPEILWRHLQVWTPGSWYQQLPGASAGSFMWEQD